MRQKQNGSGNNGGKDERAAPSWILDLRERLAKVGGRLPTSGDRIVFAVPLFVDAGALWTILGEDVVTEEGELARISFPAARVAADDPAWGAAGTLIEEVLGLDAKQALRIGELEEIQALGGLRVLPLVVAIPRPEMAGRTLSVGTEEGLALFPMQVMQLLEPQRSSKRTVELPEGPAEVEVLTVDDHQLWGPSLEVLERLVGVLAS